MLDDGAEPIRLAVDEETPDLPERLERHGYSHVDMVGRRGQFAVRGGIVDVFPATAENPVRVELWGDEVTDIRAFSVGDQRTISEVEVPSVEVHACRALLLDDAVTAKAAELAAERSGDVQEMLVRISDGQWVDGMEALIPLLTDRPLRPLTELMPDGTHTLLCGPERIRSRAADLIATGEEFMAAAWETAAMGGGAPIPADGLEANAYRQLDDVRRAPWWSVSPPGMLDGDVTEDEVLPLTFEPGPEPRGDLYSKIGRASCRERV